MERAAMTERSSFATGKSESLSSENSKLNTPAVVFAEAKTAPAVSPRGLALARNYMPTLNAREVPENRVNEGTGPPWVRAKLRGKSNKNARSHSALKTAADFPSGKTSYDAMFSCFSDPRLQPMGSLENRSKPNEPVTREI